MQGLHVGLGALGGGAAFGFGFGAPFVGRRLQGAVLWGAVCRAPFVGRRL